MPIERLDPTDNYFKSVLETAGKAQDPMTKSAVLQAGICGYALKEEDLPELDKVIDDTIIERLGHAS